MLIKDLRKYLRPIAKEIIKELIPIIKEIAIASAKEYLKEQTRKQIR